MKKILLAILLMTTVLAGSAKIQLTPVASGTAQGMDKNVSEIIEKQHAAMLAHPKVGGGFPHRKFEVPAADLENHRAFMEKINK